MTNAVDKISVVVPVLNEEGNVRALVGRLKMAFERAIAAGILSSYELVFVDDHSTDRTLHILNELAMNDPAIIVREKVGTRGKALSLVQGFSYAKHELVAMIDGDLQYPPEAIPEMVQRIQDGFDVVVSNRVARKEHALRNFVSKAFVLFFVRFLHGFRFDVQSGLKVFRKRILREVALAPTPWTFDLEFLLGARNAGYRITTHDIVFDERRHGTTKVALVRASLEIGRHALQRAFRRVPVVSIPADDESMRGAGIAYKGKRFITHSTLPHSVSAFRTLSSWQKLFLWGAVSVLLSGFLLAPFTTAIIFTTILSAIYFLDVVFNLCLVIRSLAAPPEIEVTDDEVELLDERTLPIYTVLCPLYREGKVLPYFLKALDAIDWPKHKLDVVLLLEEDDYETITAARELSLPRYVRTVVVPHSLPKTKPKACNYGLSFAKGSYLVVYDAEDIPDPLQLKKVHIAFARVPEDVKCLQAKLNYHNAHQNILTRFFTAEYSLWFDMILPGLQSLNTSIPLGGTSNHFRVKDLREFHGWDPFNVTEDCDLGVRLFKFGYKTAIVDSVTLEEANSRLWNWIRQRSRWIKGYMQTYLVHMRHPFAFVREHGMHAFLFQLNVGAKVAFLIINPLLWIATISYFVLYGVVGETIEALYPTPVFYMAATSLVFGNFLYLYDYMIGCAKRNQWSLIKYVLFIPFYWLLASVAAVIALYQIVMKPHYWEKTQHGFHLGKTRVLTPHAQAMGSERLAPKKEARPPVRPLKPAFVSSPVRRAQPLRPAPPMQFPRIPRPALSPLFSRIRGFALSGAFGGGMLIAGSMIGNVLNFLYNAYLSRAITVEQFGLVTLIGSFLALSTVPLNALTRSVNHKSAYYLGKFGLAIPLFWRHVRRRALFVGLAITAIWIIATPFLAPFFNSSSLIPFLLFAPVWIVAALSAVDGGFLGGNLKFHVLGIVVAVEAAAKLLATWVLVNMGYAEYVYASIPLSIALAFLIGWFYARRILGVVPRNDEEAAHIRSFPKQFYATSVLWRASAVAFLSFDTIMAQHFLSPEEAGQYALVSLAGKMIFFIGGLFSQFLLPLVSRAEGAARDSRRIFSLVFLSSTSASALVYVGVGVFGFITLPMLFGAHAVVITSYLPLYGLGMLCFAAANSIVNFRQIKEEHLFPIVGFLLALAQIGGILLFHGSITEIVLVMTALGVGNLLVVTLVHRFYGSLVSFGRNARDFLGVFSPSPLFPVPSVDGSRVLIFNWRDMRHVWAGGAEVYVHEMAKGLVQNGNMVTIFCGNDGHAPRHEVVDGVRIIRRGGFYTVYVWAFFYYLTHFRGVYDFIIDCHNGIPFFTPLYAKEPVYCLMHHVHQEVFWYSLARPFASLASFLENKAMPYVYRNIKFITVSESSKKDMEALRLGMGGIEVVCPGVHMSQFTPGEKSANPLILYLGRLKAYKSVRTLLLAFKRVLDVVPNAELVIAGSGEEEVRLKTLARDLKIDSRVDFRGKVTEEEKLSLFRRAWVFANPSLMEGWGITTIEANACGTPVVASNVPGLRDSVRNPHTGYLVRYGDSDAFADRLVTLITDNTMRRAMSREAQVWAARFDWPLAVAAFRDALAKYRKI